MNFVLIGILLGFGAAVPIGPVNLEIIRRNLHYGTAYGIALGLGACTADVTYLVLLSFGVLSFLNEPQILKYVGIGGSLILAWFAYGAFKTNTTVVTKHAPTPSLLRYLLEGFIITLLNPITILFWASISSQISIIGLDNSLYAILLTGLGVMIGTITWILSLNTALHFTRHRLNARTMQLLNYLGGIILLGFSLFGLIKAFQLA
jgi:L-lysine exporter family protein LysE/ArgO